MGILKLGSELIFGRTISQEEANRISSKHWIDLQKSYQASTIKKHAKEESRRKEVYKDIVKNKLNYLKGDTEIKWSKKSIDNVYQYTVLNGTNACMTVKWYEMLDKGYRTNFPYKNRWIGRSGLDYYRQKIDRMSTQTLLWQKYASDIEIESANINPKTSRFNTGEKALWEVGKFGMLGVEGDNWWDEKNSNSQYHMFSMTNINPHIHATHAIFKNQKVFDWVFKQNRTKQDYEENDQTWKEEYDSNQIKAEKDFNYEFWFRKNIWTPGMMKAQIKWNVPVPFSKEQMIEFGGEDYIEYLQQEIKNDETQKALLEAKRENTWITLETHLKKRPDYDMAIKNLNITFKDFDKILEKRRKDFEYQNSDEYKEKLRRDRARIKELGGLI